MAPALLPDPLPLHTDAGGVVRVAGTRVTLTTILTAYLLGQSAEQIVESYSVVPLAAVHAIVAHYLNHQPEYDAYLRDQAAAAEAVRERITSAPGYGELRDRTLTRRRLYEAQLRSRAAWPVVP